MINIRFLHKTHILTTFHAQLREAIRRHTFFSPPLITYQAANPLIIDAGSDRIG